MSSSNQYYGSRYSYILKRKLADELEELLFCYPSSPLRSRAIWDLATNPPALAAISRQLSASPSSEGVPEATMAFYAFIEGEYYPLLFSPDPFEHFLGKGASSSSSVKAMRSCPISKKNKIVTSLNLVIPLVLP
ncbi:hypothetical protein O181_123636 [Austropuccinia psidii MF-1]|uniref:Uncharacterized protein n=1 Tax=Austropuccinia psidii MF-1 TaxID=1389203 RepID=A0A9Q3KNU5_9BASI|nr:hypothetical protein [Austropuccinia psidii MF-1]